jgi:hypothetical protein
VHRRLTLAPQIVLVALVVAVALLASGCGKSNNSKTSADPKIAGLQTFSNLSRNHVQTRVHYPQTPPVGGDHFPVWQTCSFYGQPIYNETGVHSMEHGAVWITFQPDLPADQVAILKNLAKQDYMLVSPYPGLPSPVVASAWGKQVKLPSATDPRLSEFIKAFRHGPQAPEKGVSCQSGTTAVAANGQNAA